MGRNDMRFFCFAAKAAAMSDYGKFHIGAVAVYKGRVIAEGYNSKKTHPFQKKYDVYRGFRDGHQPPHYLHAEIDCLNRIDKDKYDMSKVKIYVYRKRRDMPHGISRPCPACMQAIKDAGIKEVFYSTDQGYANEHIC